MATRKHVHQIELPVAPPEVFDILITPSAIRDWWFASRAIVMARQGGAWAAAWGDAEDDPDFITTATIEVFDPPRRLVLADFKYYAKSGPLPFEADLKADFTVEALPEGSVLKIEQDGFPVVSEADEFYAACEKGWRDTFDSIKRYFSE
jgi:uncharacterized protein YndB with AHSA1/START domain